MLLASVLLITGIGAILLEFFIPAFGIIGVIGAASVIGSIVLAFKISSLAGSVFLIAALIIVPAMVFIFFKFFPKTYFGKKLILGPPPENPENQEDLNGITGIALTDLRPSGSVMAGEKKYSAVTAGEYIEKDSRIRIVKVEGNKIIVREDK